MYALTDDAIIFFRGLLSGHILAEYLQLRANIMPWYRGELLDLAKDLGYRFLPAFNTTTGIPFGRVKKIHRLKTKCGSLILFSKINIFSYHRSICDMV